jgi:hypothetical protein
MVQPEDIYEPEWVEWFRMTPKSGGRRVPSYGNFICEREGRLIPTPILKVLFSFQKTTAQALLMGGQACVFYGAAEFSRNTDLAVLSEPSNLESIKAALEGLQGGMQRNNLAKGNKQVRRKGQRQATAGSIASIMRSRF